MVSLLKVPARLMAALFATGMLVAAGANTARPGTLNYVEGSVTLAGQAVGGSQIGKSEVASGQILATTNGKAEMLLTPGVVIRIGDNSSIRMVSPSLTDTRVELLRGEAMVEAAQVLKENRIGVITGGVSTLIEKHGIYRFDGAPANPTVSVFDGKVKVLADDRKIEFGKGKQLALLSDRKPQKFDRDQTGELYAWSKLRSSYMADANQSAAQTVVVDGGGWYGNGWYWSPWYRTWAFLPANGYLTSPFGFGFYSPSYWSSWGPVWHYPAYRTIRPGPSWHGPAIRGGGGIRGGGHVRGGIGGGTPRGGGARTLGPGARM